MPKFKIKAKKEVYFTTIVEAEHSTDALLKVSNKERIWEAIKNNNNITHN